MALQMIACLNKIDTDISKLDLIVLYLNHKYKILELLENNDDDIDFDTKDIYGETLIHIICRFNLDYDLLKKLVSKKISINILDNDGNTPLMKSCFHIYSEKNSINVFKLLIRNGAILDVKNKNKESALSLVCCADNHNYNIIKYLKDKYEENKLYSYIDDLVNEIYNDVRKVKNKTQILEILYKTDGKGKSASKINN